MAPSGHDGSTLGEERDDVAGSESVARAVQHIADTGGGRVLWLDTASGEEGRTLRQTQESIDAYARWEGVAWGVLVEGLDRPGGLALDAAGHLFVAEYGTGVLFGYDLAGEQLQRLDTGWGEAAVYGIEIGPDDRLWIADNSSSAVYRLDTK